MKLHKLFTLLAIASLFLPVACTEKESGLGLELQDPFTLYNGTRDTVELTACTILDDSLSTSGYSAAVFGNYADPTGTFGKVNAILYSQVMPLASGINNTSSSIQFDSAVITLVIDSVYPIMPDSTARNVHVIVKQLAEELLSDTAYYSTQELQLSSNTLFDGDVTYYADSLKLKLNENAFSMLRDSCSQADFLHRSKGIAIYLADNAQTMFTVDLAATNTRLTLYYHYNNNPESPYNYTFTINSEASHAMHYGHTYNGSALAPFATNRKDSIAGTEKLYLEPLGGTRIRLNMQSYISAFREKHPYAVIHYAELVLPTHSDSDTSTPVRILALKREANGTSTYVTDANVITNQYTYSGFDGFYNREKKQYRLRVTRHLQELLRSGKDYGTELIIDARRSSAFRAIINGTSTDNPIHIDFIYSE